MAAAVVSVPANEGISVKNERDDPEINAMALKIKESLQKNNARPAPTSMYINRAGRSVPVASLPAASLPAAAAGSSSPPSKLVAEVSEDITSIKGIFGYHSIGHCMLPFIYRTVDGEKDKFVSVRIAETQLLSKYMNYLHPDIYTCTSVRSHFITEHEAKLFNEINSRHSDHMFGKEPFTAGKEYVVRLFDAVEFYSFIEVCYKKLLCNIAPGRNEKCGFIRINSESVVPYCIKDEQKYVPLFYFEGETDNLRLRAEKLEDWNLAYLKFCCKVQGIRNELFASDSCIVTSLDDIKNYFPPETNFEEYWPAKVVDTQLLTNQKNSHVNPPNSWVRAPPPMVGKVMGSCAAAAANPEAAAIQQQKQLAAVMASTVTVTVAGVVPQQQQAMAMANGGTYQNGGWPPNQMVNSYNTQLQLPPTRGYFATSRNQNAVAQYYNANSAMLQTNGQMNNVNHAPPPPLVRATNNNGSTIVNNTASYANNSINQPITTMYNPVNTSSGVISNNAQMRQFYSNQRSAASGQAQQLMTTAQSYGQPIAASGTNARVTNTQQRNALRNIVSAAVPVSEVIDLSSPPSSPVPQAMQDTRQNPYIMKKIPERPWRHETSNNVSYKIQKANLQGKIIHCINAKPYVYSELMVTVDDLVQTLFPTCSTNKCAFILCNTLKITLYSGNSEQMTVLRENGRLRTSSYVDDTPLVMLQDVNQVLLQLKNLITKYDDMRSQEYHPSVQAKRQRMS